MTKKQLSLFKFEEAQRENQNNQRVFDIVNILVLKNVLLMSLSSYIHHGIASHY